MLTRTTPGRVKKTSRTGREYTGFSPGTIPRSHNSAFVAPGGLRRVLRLLNLPNHQIECPGNVEVEESTGLGECTAEYFC